MEDPLWRYMDSSIHLKREELQSVVQKKKIDEIYNWFSLHFDAKTTPVGEYIKRCPIVILQGPSGCGKTSTIKFVAHQFKIPVKEYSETSDMTAIDYELMRSYNKDEAQNSSIDYRKALRFERFVINSLRYNTLYSTEEADDPASEFDSDDGYVEMTPSNSTSSSKQSKQPSPTVTTGVVILIETPLTFAKSQRILVQSLHRLITTIRDLSRRMHYRRIAIVFETLEGDRETVSLPTKVKQSFNINVFKFNPITRANMKKLVENILQQKKVALGKEDVEQIAINSDGDIRACLNTLQLTLCNSSNGVYIANKNNYKSIKSTSNDPTLEHQTCKKQKLVHHERVRHIKLNPDMLRDTTRCPNFFHLLGKIFYQKRFYPVRSVSERSRSKSYRSRARPYQKENSTEYLAGQLDFSPSNLISWLHEHYHQFCSLEKAASLSESLSDVDTISISAMQSTQFYEFHNSLDQLQTYLAIEATIFNLYEDNSYQDDPDKRKKRGEFVVKSSVFERNKKNELCSFKKPVSMSLYKVVEDHRKLLGYCSSLDPIDPLKVLLDYAPYLNWISAYRKGIAVNEKPASTLTEKPASTPTEKPASTPTEKPASTPTEKPASTPTEKPASTLTDQHPIFDDKALIEVLRIVETMNLQSNIDYDLVHEAQLQFMEEFQIM